MSYRRKAQNRHQGRKPEKRPVTFEEATVEERLATGKIATSFSDPGLLLSNTRRRAVRGLRFERHEKFIVN